MATRYVAATGGLASGSAATAATAWTTAYMNSNVAVGDTVYFLTGTYTGADIAPAARPASEAQRITFMSAPGHYATFDGRRATLTDRGYITLYNMRFITRSGASIWAGLTNQTAATANTARNLILDTLTFDDWGTYVDNNYNFAQIFLRGRNHIIRNCTFLKWKGTDGIQLWGEGHLVEDNDFGWSDTGHGSLVVYAGRTVVRRNYFRNKWSRPGEMVGMSETDALYYAAPDSMWEDNVFFDCGFSGLADGTQNEGYNAEGWAVTGDQPIGDQQLQKLGGSGTIYRNNLWVGSNDTPQRGSADYWALLQIVAYDRSGGTQQKHAYMEHMRIYHNTFYDNALNMVYFNPPPSSQGIPTADVRATDNRWLNNIVHNQDLNDFDLAGNTSQWFNTWEFHNNIFTGTFRDRGRGTVYSSFTAWANVWNRPSQATGNVTTAPTFRDSKYRPATSSENNSYPESNRNLKLVRDNFRLHTNSPVGRSTAVALATVSQTYASATTSLAVSDVYPFYPGDANNHVDGDEIVVNGQTTRVTSRNKTTSVLTVSPAVTANDGDEIWLAKYGESPDRGILPLVADDPASETMILDPVQRGQTFTSIGTARNTFTATGIFPSSYSLLEVTVCYRYYTPNATPPNFNPTATTTIGDFTLTRVVQQLRHATTTSGIAKYIGQVEANAVSGTITVGVEGGAQPTMWAMQVVEWRGHHIAAPIRQSASSSNTSSTLSVTLPQTPLADSIVSGAIYSREDLDGVTEGSGFEEIDDYADGNVALQTQWRREPTTTVDWSGLNSSGQGYSNGNAAVAVEIVAADANTHYLFADDLTAGTPVLGNPTVSTVGNLQPLSLTAGTPQLGEPVLTQAHALTASTLVAGTPQLGTPTLAQTHTLTPNSLTTGAPVLESPAVATVATGELVPLSLVSGVPQLGVPTLTQTHKLYAAPVTEA